MQYKLALLDYNRLLQYNRTCTPPLSSKPWPGKQGHQWGKKIKKGTHKITNLDGFIDKEARGMEYCATVLVIGNHIGELIFWSFNLMEPRSKLTTSPDLEQSRQIFAMITLTIQNYNPSHNTQTEPHPD